MADVTIEAAFSPDYARIEQLNIIWNSPWIDNAYRTEDLEKWSLTARGIPMEPDLWKWRTYKVDIDNNIEGMDKPPEGFKVIKTDYLKTRVEHKARTLDDGTRVTYDDTQREDQFDVSKAKNTTIIFTFRKPKTAPVAKVPAP